MIKKKAKSKTAAKKTAEKRSSVKSKKETNPAEVRKEISKLVEAHASRMAKAVIGDGEKGQLAPVKYLFEMASIYPPAQDGTQATEEEDCLAKILLARMQPPAKTKEDEEPESEAEAAPINATSEVVEESSSVASGEQASGASTGHTVE